MLNHFRSLVAVVLLMSLVAGCMGGDDDDDPTATTEQETSSTVTSSEDQAQATGADASPEGTDPEPDATDAEGTPAEPVPDASPTESGEDATTAPSPQPTDDLQFADAEFAFGWNVATRGDDLAEEHNSRTAQVVNESGFGWVRFQLEWRSFERQPGQWDPLPVDRKIDEFSSQGLNILLVIAKAPDWALSDEEGKFLNSYLEFEQFATFIGERYGDKVQAWEIWNEQNLALEFGGEVQISEYIELLEAGSRGIREGDPDALILFGGLTPTGVMDPAIGIDDANYLRAIYSYNNGEIKDYFDILGVHLNSTHNPPDDRWPDQLTSGHEGWNDHPSFFFRRGEELRQIMVENGDGDKPIWITEFGWTTANQDPGREYGANNTDEEVAQFLTRAMEIATEEWEWCTGAFVWNLNWSTLVDPADHKYPSSALYGDWTPRPAYEAMKAFPKGGE